MTHTDVKTRPNFKPAYIEFLSNMFATICTVQFLCRGSKQEDLNLINDLPNTDWYYTHCTPDEVVDCFEAYISPRIRMHYCPGIRGMDMKDTLTYMTIGAARISADQVASKYSKFDQEEKDYYESLLSMVGFASDQVEPKFKEPDDE